MWLKWNEMIIVIKDYCSYGYISYRQHKVTFLGSATTLYNIFEKIKITKKYTEAQKVLSEKQMFVFVFSIFSFLIFI